MMCDLRKLPIQVQEVLSVVSQKASHMGFHSFLVGGMVRDLLLGVKSTDIDIVVEGDVNALADGLEKYYQVKAVRHQAFKTATFYLENDMILDLATARCEQYKKKGALPVVKRATLKEDIFRRDFTINGLAVSLNLKDYGALIDVAGAKKDVENKQIRVFHDESFLDDPTRILRAVRYAVKCNFKIEDHTLMLMKEAIASKALTTISPVRYFNEFKKMLLQENALTALNTLAYMKGLLYVKWDSDVAFYMRKSVECRALEVVEDRCLLLMLVLCSFLSEKDVKHFLADIQCPKEFKTKVLFALQYKKIFDETRNEELLKKMDKTVLVFLYVMSQDEGMKKKMKEML